MELPRHLYCVKAEYYRDTSPSNTVPADEYRCVFLPCCVDLAQMPIEIELGPNGDLIHDGEKCTATYVELEYWTDAENVCLPLDTYVDIDSIFTLDHIKDDYENRVHKLARIVQPSSGFLTYEECFEFCQDFNRRHGRTESLFSCF